eukprot:COSAG06_NODE_2007_length_7858_cov_23.947158_1_plen_75_part_00
MRRSAGPLHERRSRSRARLDFRVTAYGVTARSVRASQLTARGLAERVLYRHLYELGGEVSSTTCTFSSAQQQLR